MSTLTLVAVVLVVAVIAYAVYTSIQAGLARTSELKALAPQPGLTFVGDFAPTSTANATGDPRDDFEALLAAFGDFRRFQGSMRPRLRNWMRGERDGTSVSLFDYDEGHTQRDIATIQTLAWIEDPGEPGLDGRGRWQAAATESAERRRGQDLLAGRRHPQ